MNIMQVMGCTRQKSVASLDRGQSFHLQPVNRARLSNLVNGQVMVTHSSEPKELEMYLGHC